MTSQPNLSRGGQTTGTAREPTNALTLFAAIVVGLVSGGCLGAFVVGPRLDPHPAAAECWDDDVLSSIARRAGGDVRGGAPRPMYMIDNLVVNPAGTHGRRFLLTTIAFEVPSEALVEIMRERDAEVRDALVGVLGSKTVGDLSDVAARESVKEALRRAVEDLVGVPVIRLYTPQFVIQ